MNSKILGCITFVILMAVSAIAARRRSALCSSDAWMARRSFLKANEI